jgi:hypothetical protein
LWHALGPRDLYAALLPVQERVLGPEHPDTLTELANWRRLHRVAREEAKPS